MIKGRNVMCLDGNFKKESPAPEAISYLVGDKWFVVKHGPRYVCTYEVTEYDEEGARWLEGKRRDLPVRAPSDGAGSARTEL